MARAMSSRTSAELVERVVKLGDSLRCFAGIVRRNPRRTGMCSAICAARVDRAEWRRPGDAAGEAFKIEIAAEMFVEFVARDGRRFQLRDGVEARFDFLAV